MHKSLTIFLVEMRIFALTMGNKDNYNQSGLTGTGHLNIRKVKGETKVGGFINEGAYINFNFSDFIQGFLNFFRPEDPVAKVLSLIHI